ncbi:PLP-dependent aminotransferase family protein [Streptomyces sp. NBC_01433]|uniref:aminotransferase-like domain-containing protein n=1 Tax=Streptomyces sp. NBC_01433 TaxID=2903864 RepID=UPI00225B42C1|nr:PLP-dependent aminotransferase family protein [Streptomyces sp. NBC_01433]MCX4677187.1 PLP-dependent aminotransferase family protein [Streptomyces sp. NBC_01433]
MDRIPPTRLSRLLTGWSEGGTGAMPRLLADALRELAQRGDVAPGTVLPSQRALAAALGVSRSTVTAAYGMLEAEGRLESRHGSGSRLRRSGVVGEPASEGRLASFGARESGIDLSSGALDGLPAVAAAVGALTAGDLTTALAGDGYLPYGLPELREAIAEYHRSAGLPTSPEQILVTAGSQQAVWLITQGLVEPGDTVVVEDPTYRGALEALRSRGARLVPLPAASSHGDGPAALDRLAGHIRPRLVYLQPSVHNPTGRGMDEHTRLRWAAALAEHGVYAVEDNAYAELALGHDTAPVSLASRLPPAATATIGTLSKLFWGGLRVGWIRASTTVVHRLADIKKSVDLSCPVVDQMLAVRLLGQLPEARAHRRSQLRERLTETERLLHAHAPGWRWERPAGGSALWAEIPGADAEATAQLARRAGVLIVPGPAFSAVDGFRHHLRLPFADRHGNLEKALPVLVDCAERSRGPR